MFAWEIEPLRNVELFLAIPISPSFPFLHYQWELALERATKPTKVIKAFSNASHSVAHAREELVHAFLNSGATHLLFLDSDVMLRNDTLLRLLIIDEPLVIGRYHDASSGHPEVFHHSGMSRMRDAPIAFKEHEVVINENPEDDPFLAGLGLCLIKREVFEKLNPPYFLYSSNFKDEDDYWRVSEDFYFLLRCQRELGIKPVYVTDAIADHIVYGTINERGISLLK